MLAKDYECKSEHKVKVTVIIPVYKVEKYLEESVKSVLNQTYSNIKIILVDDGSPDRCPQICEQFAERNNNISVIHKKNGGLSSARNTGLKKVDPDTDYILFLDSDDQLLPDAIEGMLYNAIRAKAEMVIPDQYIKVCEKTGKESLATHFTKSMYNTDPKQFAMNVLMEQGRAWRASALLYSYQAIKTSKAVFPEGHIAEDISFNLMLLAEIENIVFYSNPTLKNLKREESITASFQNDFEKDIWYIDKQAQNFVKMVGKDDLSGQEKVDALLCRNLVMYLFSVMSRKNTMSYQEKVQKSVNLLNHANARNVIRKKHKIPYFESDIKRMAVRFVYFMLRQYQDKVVFKILSLLS